MPQNSKQNPYCVESNLRRKNTKYKKVFTAKHLSHRTVQAITQLDSSFKLTPPTSK